MSDKSKWVVFASLSAMLFFSAGLLAFSGQDGWGWFLFCGLLAMPCDKSEESKKEVNGENS